MPFDITGIVSDVGESFTISGITRTFNERGDPTETYFDHFISGVVQVMDGSEEEVKEGILQKEDIIVFVDEDASGVSGIALDNNLNISTITSGIFRIVNVIHNSGHFEVHGQKIHDTSP